MAAARAAGATTVVVAEVVETKRRRATERGADAVVDPADQDLAEAVRAETDGEGVDVVIEASGAESAIRGSLDAVRRGGTVVFVGLPTEAAIPLDVGDIVDRELDVRGSFRYRNAYPAAVDLIANGAADVAGLVDFETDLEEIEAAFERALEPETVKGMVRVGE